MRILPYADEWFQPLVAMLRTNWAGTHPLYDKTLFDWQYRTQRQPESLLAVDGEEVVGFLGNIPGRYQINGQLVAGAALSMWCVAERLRNGGLGVLLLRQTERTHPVTLTLGAGPQTIPMYQRMGYSVLPRLQRYVLSIDEPGFRALCEPIEGPATAAEWSPPEPSPKSTPIENRQELAAEELAALYQRSVAPAFAFSLHRDADFWEWRYLHSPGFRYQVLGDCRTRGAAVVRVERVTAPDRRALDGLRMLRIIELIPATAAVWRGQADAGFLRLLGDVRDWGAAQGCVAADFQCTHGRLDGPLLQAGFRQQGRHADAKLAPMFQPLRWHANPLNFVWKISSPAGQAALDAEQTYFVKSDCDMDRPVAWPLPGEA